jgi:phenylacetate-coenzyme A ligase PaaK-like adenylate-forming protein
MNGLMEPVVRQAIFPLWVRRDHPHFRSYLKEFERTQFLERNALETLQCERLGKLLAHAYSYCPYYKRRLAESGFHPNHLTDFSQLSAVPILTKREIQDHSAEMLATNFPRSERVPNQTGGSTGSPLQFYVDRERFDSRMASAIRHDSWAGLEPGVWRATLWGARLDQVTGSGWWDWCRNNLLYRTVSLNTSVLRETDWNTFVATLRRKLPRFLVSYAQSAVLFARYVRERRIKDIQFQSIITTAEVLLPGQREFLEQTFGSRVFNRYGCREVSVIASECVHHTGMHVNAEALLVEIIPDPSIPPPAGRIVITDLLNYSMPLIRYEIGDVGRWSEKQMCPCGRGLPLLAEVQGRTTDFLVMPDGRRVSGPALTLVVADMADIRQVQFVQRDPHSVVLRVVPGRNYGSETRTELRRRLDPYLSESTTLTIEEADHIVSEVSGKYRFVICDMGRFSVKEGPEHGAV